jgi:hypothetical protein
MPETTEPPVELWSVFQDPNIDLYTDAPQIAVPQFDYSDPGLGVAQVSPSTTAVDASPVPAPAAAPLWVAPTPTPAPAQSASPEGV